MSWWRRGPTHGEVVRWVARCDKIPKQPVMRGGGGRLTCHISADASSWRRTHDRDLRPTEGGGSLLRLAGSLLLPCFQFWVRSLAGEESWRNSRGVLGAIFCLVGQPPSPVPSMAVASSFDQWQKDVFFSAAEEVQESADVYAVLSLSFSPNFGV
ncbi:hypothetical protein BHE74_00037866 [Ensete ventricosum]|nr:hypothetical protein BHE74_00037866 [Ensete ventricosum]